MASVASQLTEEVTAHAQSDNLEDAREICADGTYFPNNLRISATYPLSFVQTKSISIECYYKILKFFLCNLLPLPFIYLLLLLLVTLRNLFRYTINVVARCGTRIFALLRKKTRVITAVYICMIANPCGRMVKGVGLQPLDCWGRGFISCVFCVLCSLRPLRRADHSFREESYWVCGRASVLTLLDL